MFWLEIVGFWGLGSRRLLAGAIGYLMGMESGSPKWNERFAARATATHARRIAVYLVMLLLGIGMTIWLVSDPSGATSGSRGVGAVLAPVLIVVTVFWLFRELRTGDSRPVSQRPPTGHGAGK